MTIGSAWFGVGRHAGTPLAGCSELLDVTVFRRKVAADFLAKQVTKNTPTTNRRLCPIKFCAVRVALVTTTRGYSECRPDADAEATSRVMALCDVKQEPQGFVADPKKNGNYSSA